MKLHWRLVDKLELLAGFPQPAVCPLCGHLSTSQPFETREAECAFLGGRLVRHVCPSCDLVFGPQKMFELDTEMLDLEYRNLYRIYSEGDSTDSVIRTFHLLDPRPEGIYLDYGCGGEWSRAIEELRSKGWEIVGFEPSVERSTDHVLSDWADISERRFDGILTHNVLEHLFDPADTTRRLASLLAPGGRIVHATPCFEYCYEYSRFHVFFFLGRSAQLLAKLSGMSIVDRIHDGEFMACILQPSAPNEF